MTVPQMPQYPQGTPQHAMPPAFAVPLPPRPAVPLPPQPSVQPAHPAPSYGAGSRTPVRSLGSPAAAPAAPAAPASAAEEVPAGQRDFSVPAHAALKQYFGYDSFRPGQFPVVNSILNGRDVMAVMPTGAGKSVCYQLPATRPNALALVVTPLRALMRDQVQHLREHGIAAALIDSQVDWRERNDIYRAAAARQISLLYAAPERFNSRDFIEFAQQVPIDMIVVDEAHCVLQWGSDFRPDYRNIADFVRKLPTRPVIAAFTATATPHQRDEIVANLGLNDPYRITTSFNRPNIHLRVIEAKPTERMRQIIAWSKQHEQECGIVYCDSRKRTEQMAEGLRQMGINADFFHAKMPEERKGQVQDAFLKGDIRVICATTAFGMGVDKSDVRWVINDSVPASMEEYYQMAGRAGRDRQRSTAILMWSPGDFANLRRRLANAGSALSDPDDIAMAQQAAKDRLDEMSRYCEAERCLRAEMLGYFGERAPQTCGDCSVCEHEGETLVELSDAERRRIDEAARGAKAAKSAKSARGKAGDGSQGGVKPPTKTEIRKAEAEERRKALAARVATVDGDGRAVAERAILSMVADLRASTGTDPAVSSITYTLAGEDADFIAAAGLTRHPRFGELKGRFDKDLLRGIVMDMVGNGALVMGDRRRLSLPGAGASGAAPSAAPRA